MPRKRKITRGASHSGTSSGNVFTTAKCSSPDSGVTIGPSSPSSPGASPIQQKLFRNKNNDNNLNAARGRFKGALLDAMDCNADSDSSFDHPPLKGQRNFNEYKLYFQGKRELSEFTSDDEDSLSDKGKKSKKKFMKSNKNNAYVMKLFDRSVDLAQFTEDTPLYIICRAWMANNPRSSIKTKSFNTIKDESLVEEGIKLPPPEGHLVSRVPPLLPEQCTRSKYNINLNYDEKPPIPKEILLQQHLTRWHAIRKKWQEQSIIYESRYAKTQEMLNEMDTNS